MEVQIGIEVIAVEVLERFGLGGIDISVAYVLADHRTIFGLHQAVIVTAARTAFGLLNQKLVEQAGHGGIDKLAAVIGVKAQNAERKLVQHSGQHRLQPSFADAWGGSYHLPLRDLIDGIDVVHAFAAFLIALMHGVHPQITRLALRIGPPPLCDGNRGRLPPPIQQSVVSKLFITLPPSPHTPVTDAYNLSRLPPGDPLGHRP